MIKAIVFDFFGVLSSDEYWDFVGAGRNADEKTFHDLADSVNKGEMEWQAFMIAVADAKGAPLREVEALYRRHYLNVPLVSWAKSELKPTYKLGLLTNAHRSYISSMLDDAGLHDLFDASLVSSDVGIIKPQPGIYRQMAVDLEVETEECVFIDDGVVNVEGAKAVGMEGLLYEGLDKLKTDLHKLLEQI